MVTHSTEWQPNSKRRGGINLQQRHERKRLTPNFANAYALLHQKTSFSPQRLCRAILPALFPAWVSPRCTIHQLGSAYANSSLREALHTLGENVFKIFAYNVKVRRKTSAPSLHFASHHDDPDKLLWLRAPIWVTGHHDTPQQLNTARTARLDDKSFNKRTLRPSAPRRL